MKLILASSSTILLVPFQIMAIWKSMAISLAIGADWCPIHVFVAISGIERNLGIVFRGGWTGEKLRHNLG
jgi:hypothetical protein